MDKLKVLVADDNKSVISFYQLALKEDSFETMYVANGREAVEAYMQWIPDIIVLDIMMPVLSGYQALKQIRELEKENGRNTAVVVSSALADKNDILDCVKVGIQGYILKPFKFEEIPGKLQEYFKGHRTKPKPTSGGAGN